MELSQRRLVENPGDGPASLRSATPPPDLTGTALTTVAAVVVFPVLSAAVALVVHPLTFAPSVLVPALVVPAFASIVISGARGVDAATAAALAVASAASTAFYLCLFGAALAVARVAVA